ncbi:MAG: hypothetical protein ACI304_09725 [Lepagella sp.]
MIPEITTKYIINVFKRVANDEHVETAELVNLPKVLDRVYGDGDGIFEMSDAVDAVVEIGSEFLDKAESVISWIGDLF